MRSCDHPCSAAGRQPPLPKDIVFLGAGLVQRLSFFLLIHIPPWWVRFCTNPMPTLRPSLFCCKMTHFYLEAAVACTQMLDTKQLLFRRPSRRCLQGWAHPARCWPNLPRAGKALPGADSPQVSRPRVRDF